MTLFRNFDVQKLLEQSVLKVALQVPDEVDQGSNIEGHLDVVCHKLKLDDIKSDLVQLFQLNSIKKNSRFSRGFPGVVLVAVVGRLIDGQYNPATNFYDISPRSLFEQHIGPTLRDRHGAPMGKSDPLNVAKNINVIDANWAKGKRPEYAAMAAARLIKKVAQASEEELYSILSILVWCYLTLARLYTREMPSIEAGVDIHALHKTLKALTTDAPAGGSTAQAIVGSLLQSQHDIFNKEGALEGVGESVYATNTTSKKPGDFLEIFDNHLRIYEVTTKKVDIQRLGESAEAVITYVNQQKEKPKSLEITFLCQPQDIALPEIDLGKIPEKPYEYQGISYYFIDLWKWSFYMLERLGSKGRLQALRLIENYVSAPSTQLKVKAVWEKLTLSTGK